MHELEELVDDRLEELPVRLEEARVLTDDVHDVRCDDRLVVLAALLLAQTQQVLYDNHQKSLLLLLAHRSAYRPDRPTELHSTSGAFTHYVSRSDGK